MYKRQKRSVASSSSSASNQPRNGGGIVRKSQNNWNPANNPFIPSVKQFYGGSVFPAETKYFDCGISADVTGGAGDWTDTEVPCDNYVNSSGTAAVYTDSALIPSAIGSGYGQVNGNRYHLKKIRVRGHVTRAVAQDQADMTTGQFYRLMLVMDTQPNGSQAQGEDVMQDIGGSETVYSYRRVSSTSGRFRVLKDLPIQISVQAAGTDGANTNSISYTVNYFSFQYVPKTPILVNIKSGNATPTIAGLETCNIFLLLCTVGATLRIDAASRAYYCD